MRSIWTKKYSFLLVSVSLVRALSLIALIALPVIFLDAQSAKLTSPTPGIATFYDFIKQVLSIIVRVGLPVAAIFLVYSGYQFLTAQGDEKKLTTAKHSFVWAVVGTAVLLGAWVLAEAIKGTVDAIRGAP